MESSSTTNFQPTPAFQGVPAGKSTFKKESVFWGCSCWTGALHLPLQSVQARPAVLVRT